MAEPAQKYTNWYVIQVMTATEQTMCESIRQIVDKDLYERCFVPMAEVRQKKNGRYVDMTRPLFPGYLFIISDRIEDVQASLWKVAKFKRLLNAGSVPVSLYEDEVRVFRTLADDNCQISLSKGFIAGDRITVTEGPLKDQEGMIKKIDRHKRIAIVEIPFLGRPVSVRVPLEIAEKRDEKEGERL